MYIVRDIFQLKFGHSREAVALLKQAKDGGLLPEAKAMRALTDFTGDAYRLVLEEGFESLADYETHLTSGMRHPDWQKWYGDFKQHIAYSHREILREVNL